MANQASGGREPASLETLFDRKRPWITFLRLYRGQGRRLAIALAAFLVKHTPVWVIPVYMGFLVDLLASGSFDAARILVPTAGMFGLLVLNIPANVAYARFLSLAVRTTEARLRMAELRKLQQVSLVLHGSIPAGSLQNKILRDVENIATLTWNLANFVTPALATLALAVVMALRASPALGIYFAVVAPLAILVRTAFVRTFNRRNAQFRRRLEAMNSRVLEMIELLPVTRAHAMEELEISRTGERVHEVRDAGRRLDALSALFGASGWVVLMIAQILSLVLMGFLATRGILTVGQVVLFQGYFTTVMGAMNSLLNILPDLAKGAESIRSVGEILESPDVERNVGKPSPPPVQGAFEYEHAAYRYPGASRDALAGLSFRVPARTTVAVTGESGSGKSTLMHLTLGFLRPSAGRVLLDGRDMEEFDLRAYRQQVAAVTQQPLLFRGTIRDNIGYGTPSLADAGIWEILRSLGAEDFVRGLPEGLDTLVGNHGSGLSGGQKQRIVMARALVRDPRVLILDEPTSALDPGSEREVRAAIERMAEGRTVFILTHRPETVGRVDMKICLAEGRLVSIEHPPPGGLGGQRSNGPRHEEGRDGKPQDSL